MCSDFCPPILNARIRRERVYPAIEWHTSARQQTHRAALRVILYSLPLKKTPQAQPTRRRASSRPTLGSRLIPSQEDTAPPAPLGPGVNPVATLLDSVLFFWPPILNARIRRERVYPAIEWHPSARQLTHRAALRAILYSLTLKKRPPVRRSRDQPARCESHSSSRYTVACSFSKRPPACRLVC